MRTIEFNNEDIKECKLALLRQDLTSLQSAFLMQHITNLEQALNEIKDYCNENIQICKNEQSNDEWECCIEELQGVLKIIYKVLGEDNANTTN